MSIFKKLPLTSFTIFIIKITTVQIKKRKQIFNSIRKTYLNTNLFFFSQQSHPNLFNSHIIKLTYLMPLPLMNFRDHPIRSHLLTTTTKNEKFVLFAIYKRIIKKKECIYELFKTVSLLLKHCFSY